VAIACTAVALSSYPTFSELVINGSMILGVAQGAALRYDFSSGTWTPAVCSSGVQVCTDGVGVWSLESDRQGIWQWLEFGEVAVSTQPIQQIAAVKGVVYALLSNGALTTTAPGSRLVAVGNATGSAIAGGSNALYMLSADKKSVLEYVDNALTQTITANAGDTFASIASADRALLAVSASTNNALLVDANGSHAITAFPGLSSYVLTLSGLFAYGSDGLQTYDPTDQSWHPLSGVPALTQVFGGGDVPYGLDASGTPYRLAPPPPPAPEPAQPDPPGNDTVGGTARALCSATDYTRWMTNLAAGSTTFAQTALNRLCIPGTHDSGCYGFWVPFVTVMCTTQTLPVDQQLAAGARFLDIRPRWDGGANDFYIFHDTWESNVKLSTVLQAVETFASANPGEIIIVFLNHLFDVSPSGGSMDALNQMVASTLTRMAAPAKFAPTNPYSTFVTANSNVIVVADVLQGTGTQQFWSANQIAENGAYAETALVPKLLAFIANQTNNPPSPLTTFWMLQCQLTPSLAGFAMLAIPLLSWLRNGTIVPEVGPVGLARVSKSAVTEALSEASVKAVVNLFIVDDYSTDWTDVAIAINNSRI
jgi:hypothetical protein